MSIEPPFSLAGWIEENRHLLRPPVGNKVLWEDAAFIVMAVGGPNARTDFHVDRSPEFFYQLEGDIVLKVVEDGHHRDIAIRQGDVFLLPPNVPHSPRRPAATLGLVVERRREPDDQDGFIWYCESCGELLHEVWLHMDDIEQQLAQVMADYSADETRRRCGRCGHLNRPS